MRYINEINLIPIPVEEKSEQKVKETDKKKIKFTWTYKPFSVLIWFETQKELDEFLEKLHKHGTLFK